MNRPFQDVKLRDWRRLVGQTGDLADIIVATLSLASVQHGVTRTRFSEFYRLFPQLQEEFPDQIPDLSATQIGDNVYSKALADGLENALCLGVRIGNPRFQYLEVDEPVGQRNLARLQGRAGSEFIERLKPVAQRLVELKKTAAVPA